jgi:hypothetical protein
MTREIEHTVEFDAHHHVIVAINTSAAMADHMQRVHEVIGDVIRRLPDTTEVTVMSAGRIAWHCTRGTPRQARAALYLTQAFDPAFAGGDVLDWCTDRDKYEVAPERNTLLIVTCERPDDFTRWQAYAYLNHARREPIAIVVLTVGDYDGSDMMLPAVTRRMINAPLVGTRFLIRTPTGSDRPDLAHAPTVPPSLAPPSPVPPPPATARERLELAFDVPAGSLPDVIVDSDGVVRDVRTVDGGEKRERTKGYSTARHHAPYGRSAGKYTVENVKLTGCDGGTEYVDVERHAPVPPPAHHAPDPTPASDHGFGGGGASDTWSAPDTSTPDPNPTE